MCSDTDGHLYFHLADGGATGTGRVFARMSGGLAVGTPGSRPGDVDVTVTRADCMALARTRPAGVRLPINGGGGGRCYFIDNMVVIEPASDMASKSRH